MAEATRASEGFIGKFLVLNGAARELWLTFLIKFLSVAAYAVTNLTIKLWLSSEFGFSDEQALALVLAWSLTMTGVTLLVGSLTDALGLRKTFFLGVWVCLVARLVMVLTTNQWIALIGGAITAGSVFLMALPTAWFQTAADGWLGNLIGHGYLNLTGSIHPYYVMIALYIAIFSVGEAFYSPRVYEYAAAIAPPGQEASYSALSYIPLLLGKVIATISSGPLLAKYCPEVGERHSATMWLFFALVATVCPLGLLLLRPYIRVREVGREP